MEAENDVLQGKEKPRKKRKWLRNILVTFFTVFFLVIGGFVYFQYFFVLGTGVKTGQLNYVVYKGYVFKTYEGKLIQAGYSPGKGSPTSVQSNEFVFSVSDKNVAEQLMLAGGREVKLHYNEYKGAVPWRGYSKYVVDSIIDIKKEP